MLRTSDDRSMQARRRGAKVLGILLASTWLLSASQPVAAGEEGSGRTKSPEGAEVYFIEPSNGAVVSSPVTVKFGLRGMGVAPATVDKPNTGHHHLVIDADTPDVRVPIPANDNYRHFGGGQTEMVLELPPGKHTLQLVLGDFRHVPHDPPVVSEKIEITVE